MSIWGNPVMLGGSGGGGGIPSGPFQPSGGSDGDLYVQTFSAPSGAAGFVEYLQASGTQWIDTGLIGNQDTRYFYDYETSAAAWGFGARQSAQMRAITVSSNGTSNFSDNLDFSADRVLVNDLANRKTLFFKGFTVFSNGNPYTGIRRQSSNFTTPGTMILFGVREGTSTINLSSVAYKFYRCIIYDGTTPVADFLPAIDGNGVPCVWEDIGQSYKYNAGSGSFTAGNTAVPSPIPPITYKKVNGAWVVIS